MTQTSGGVDPLVQSTASERNQFLLAMYSEMWNNINRHTVLVWQAVAVLVGGIGLFDVVSKKLVSIDVAAAMFLLLLFWFLAHSIDAETWLIRNMRIIANIERTFLRRADLEDIHPLFDSPPPKNFGKMNHIRINQVMAWALVIVVFVYHLAARVLSSIDSSERFDPARAAPAFVFVVAGFLLQSTLLRARCERDAFQKAAPGRSVH